MSYTVDAVDEAIKLLIQVAAESGLGVTELARRGGITKARAFRLLHTLEQQGLVHRVGPQAAYYLGFRALHLGAAAQSQIDLVRVANQPMTELGEALNETIALRVLDGLATVCVARWESKQSLRVHGEVGHRRALYAGASSKLLLAHAPKALLDAVLAQERPRFTAATPVSKAALLRELAAVRRLGYALSIGERAADTAAIAVAVHDAQGQVVAALSVSTPATRMTPERMAPMLALLREKAATVSARLGWRGA